MALTRHFVRNSIRQPYGELLMRNKNFSVAVFGFGVFLLQQYFYGELVTGIIDSLVAAVPAGVWPSLAELLLRGGIFTAGFVLIYAGISELFGVY